MSAAPPTAARDDAVAVIRHLRDSGHVAYLAGGCVRDLLLGREPKDYDVATDAPPERVRQLFRNTQAVGAAFGVVLVRVRRTPIEVATFRTDGAYTDGRRPDSVRFATAEEDAKRRDFTINGLFMDPLDGDRVIDYVDGRADLKWELIRAIGDPDERFAEDHLRLLRAVRFASRLEFDIEPATADAIRRNAADLRRIAPERVADELRRMLVGPGRDTAYRELFRLGIAGQVFGFLTGDGVGPAEPSGFGLDGLGMARTFGEALVIVSLDWRWQCAGRPSDVRPWLTKPEVARLGRVFRDGLKVSNEEIAEVSGTLAGVAAMLNDPAPTVAARKRLLATPTADQTIGLLRVLSENGLHRERCDWTFWSLLELGESDFAPPPLVTGDDLTAAGAMPGPAFKRALDAAYDAQLEDRVADKPAALAVALAHLA